MRKPVLSLDDVLLLRQLSLQFGKEAAASQAAMLEKISSYSISSAASIKAFHEVLLFIKAYPANAAVYRMAHAALERTAEAVHRIMQGHNQRQQSALSGTGIANTTTIAGFSYTITQWMVQQFGNAVSLEAASGDKETGAAILHYLLPPVEYYYSTQGNSSLSHRLHALLGKEETLKKLTGLFDAPLLNGKLTDILYDQLQVFTTWQHDDPVFNRSFMTAPPYRVFYHAALKKQFDPYSVIHQPGIHSVPLTAAQQQHLVSVARASLAFYHRETDPVTYADEQQLKLFAMGRGVTIALFTKIPGRRLSIESYTGYMVFKNGIPVSYGGGWIFGHRCKIGVNIYPPFRGGESSWLFTQVLRLFKQQFNIHRFIVRPYQFGKGNREGLKSGAFWFYYKLGFRPVEEAVAIIAAEAAAHKHHTPVSTLKLFTTCNMEWSLTPQSEKDSDIAAAASRAITRLVTDRYQGNRQRALTDALARARKWLPIPAHKKLNDIELHHLQQFGLVLQLIPHFPVWTAKEKKQTLQLVLAKAQREEGQYIRLLQQHHRFRSALAELVHDYSPSGAKRG